VQFPYLRRNNELTWYRTTVIDPQVKNDARPLWIYLWSRVTLTFDLLHPSRCDTTGIYRNVRLPGLIKIRQIVLMTACQNGFLGPISVPSDLDPWPSDPKSWQFHATVLQTICANLHQNGLSQSIGSFQNIVLTSLVMDDKQTHRQTDRRMNQQNN